ncbi:coiled-coil domain-containing protein 134 isoform X1 [Rhipicephalus microplus]|uniref:coiled-coil domain-containing protein 134 isoform X1 n=1 Tax=Rhipicephalus microplus TaxID=6941 RepID=UPI001886F6FE|nr:coiled-coil domain-containing protein 134-like [Rhipicephalus microplus]XP_037285193.1 coiled-coil domain-containing protein 134-like [Rhipicephalus microplus]
MSIDQVFRLLLAATLLVVGFTQDSRENVLHVQQYRKMFKMRRAERLEAVKSILKLDNFEKQAKLVNIVLEKINEVLTTSKLKLESSDYIPGGAFPEDESTRDALSQVLENTAFFGEIILRLPNIAHAVLNMNKAGAVVLNWAIGFSNSTELYDETTTKLINLVAQELGLVERDPNYHNPYAVKQAKSESPVPPTKPVPKMKKKKIQRGPRLSRAEL